MARFFKSVIILLIAVLAVFSYSILTDKTTYSHWRVSAKQEQGHVSWAGFQWVADSMGGKYFTKAAMFIPCRLEGLPYTFFFQFDLGASHTAIYENNFRSFLGKYPELKTKFRRLRSPLQFWNSKKALSDVVIHFGDYTASNTLSYFMKDYGEEQDVAQASPGDTFQLGTIGADLFQGKILIIDFPAQRFAICDHLPEEYRAALHDITLDTFGRVLLPFQNSRGKAWLMFDNGSSVFDLLVPSHNTDRFSAAMPIDTLQVNSWGERHTLVGRPVQEPFILAGQTFSKGIVYEDQRPGQENTGYDGIAGNALFWEHTVIIDFKQRKFGVQ